MAYQLFDASGRTRIRASGLSVTLDLEVPSQPSLGVASAACGLPSSTTGIGLCSAASAPTGWFSAAGPVAAAATVRVGYAAGGDDDPTPAAASEAAAVTLALQPTFSALVGAGMTATLPSFPLVAGEVFTVPIVAATNGHGLTVWVVRCHFDAASLTFVSAATDSAFTPAVVTLAAGGGEAALSTSGLATGYTAAQVTGSSVAVVTLTFKVAASATGARDVSGAFSFEAVQMVNPYSIAFASGLAGQVNDARGGSQASGQLSIAALSFAGIFASVPRNELVNTAPLNGADISAVISAVAVYGRKGYGNKALSRVALSCAVASDAASQASLRQSACTVTASEGETRGAPAASVTVSYGGHTTSLAFKVWFPTRVWLNASDARLGLVLPLSTHGAVADAVRSAYALHTADPLDPAGALPRYQRALLTATAVFSTSSSETDSEAWTVDVTSLVTFTSSDPAVAAVGLGSDGYPILAGVAPGSVLASIAVPTGAGVPPIRGGPVSVAVTAGSDDATAFVRRLVVVVVSGAEWVSPALSPRAQTDGGVGLDDEVYPRVSLQHSLTREGDIARVAVYAEYSDGEREDVSTECALSVDSPSLELTEGGAGGAVGASNGLGFAVASGAAGTLCGPHVTATWRVPFSGAATDDEGSGVTLGTGRGVVLMDLPKAINGSVVPSSGRLTAHGDGAADAPFEVPTAVRLGVYLRFADGARSGDVSGDGRTAFRVSSGGGAIEVSAGGVVSVQEGFDLSGSGSRPLGVSVEVSFPGWPSGLAGRLELAPVVVPLAVVRLSNVSVATFAYPPLDDDLSDDEAGELVRGVVRSCALVLGQWASAMYKSGRLIARTLRSPHKLCMFTIAPRCPAAPFLIRLPGPHDDAAQDRLLGRLAAARGEGHRHPHRRDGRRLLRLLQPRGLLREPRGGERGAAWWRRDRSGGIQRGAVRPELHPERGPDQRPDAHARPEPPAHARAYARAHATARAPLPRPRPPLRRHRGGGRGLRGLRSRGPCGRIGRGGCPHAPRGGLLRGPRKRQRHGHRDGLWRRSADPSGPRGHCGGAGGARELRRRDHAAARGRVPVERLLGSAAAAAVRLGRAERAQRICLRDRERRRQPLGACGRDRVEPVRRWRCARYSADLRQPRCGSLRRGPRAAGGAAVRARQARWADLRRERHRTRVFEPPAARDSVPSGARL